MSDRGRIICANPATGTITRFAQDGDKTYISMEGPSASIIDRNKRSHNEGRPHASQMGPLIKIAEIPIVVLYKWFVDYSKGDPSKRLKDMVDDPDFIMSKLRDPDYKYLVTVPGVL